MVRFEQHPEFLTVMAFDVDFPEPARAHDVSKAARVVAVGFDLLRLHRRLGVPGLDADHRPSGGQQFVAQPR